MGSMILIVGMCTILDELNGWRPYCVGAGWVRTHGSYFSSATYVCVGMRSTTTLMVGMGSFEHVLLVG